MNDLSRYVILIACTLTLLLGSGCNSNSVSSTNCANSPSSCSAVTPENFVASLIQLAQSGQIASAYANSTLVKTGSLQAGYFVIWDGDTQEYTAVKIVVDCDSGDHCSNSSPNSAAQAFATAPSGYNVDRFGSYNGGTYTGDPFPANTVYAGTIDWQNVMQTTMTNAGEPVFEVPAVGPGGAETYYSVDSSTRDTDLQQVQLQNTAFAQKAASLSAGLQMNFNSAVQLTLLAQKIQTLQSMRQLTDEDRAAMNSTLIGIAGVTTDQLNQAVSGAIQGDASSANALLSSISKTLGMPQATLRNQVLPMLGVSLD